MALKIQFYQSWSEVMTQTDAIQIQLGLVLQDDLNRGQKGIGQDSISFFKKAQTGGGGYQLSVTELLPMSLSDTQFSPGQPYGADRLVVGLGLALSDVMTLGDSLFYFQGQALAGGNAGSRLSTGDNLVFNQADTIRTVLGLTLQLADNLNQWMDFSPGSVDSGQLIVDAELTLSDTMNTMVDPVLSFGLSFQVAIICPHLGQQWQDPETNILQLQETFADQLVMSEDPFDQSFNFNLTVAESLTMFDGMVATATIALSFSETMSMSDGLLLGYGNLVTEQLTMSDSDLVQLLGNSFTYELLAGGNTTVATGGGGTDQMVMSEDPFDQSFNFDLTVAEPLTMLDGMGFTVGLVVQVSDAMSMSDSLLLGYGDLILVDDFVMSDLLFPLGYGNLVADTMTLSDVMVFTLSGGAQLTETLSDTMSMSDSLILGYGNQFVEQLQIVDQSGLGYGDQIADTMTLSDADVVVLGDVLRLSDTMTLSDFVVVVLGDVLGFSEQIVQSDSMLLGYGDLIADGLTLSDRLTIGYGNLISDSLALSDSLVVGYGDLISDQMAQVDSLGLGYGLLLSDVVTETDAVIVTVGRVMTLSDTMTLSDALSLGYGDLILADDFVMSDFLLLGYGDLISDTMVLSDYPAVGYGDLLSDSMNQWADAYAQQLAAASLTLSLTDQLSLTDALILGYGNLIAEANVLADQMVLTESFQLMLVDATPAALDALQALFTFGLQTGDALLFQDQLTILYGLLINDGMTQSDQLNEQLIGVLSVVLADSESAQWLDQILLQLIFSPTEIMMASLSVLFEMVAVAIATQGQQKIDGCGVGAKGGSVPPTYTQLAVDTFQQSDGPMSSANWTPYTGFPLGQIVSHICVGDPSLNSGGLFTGVSFPNDQYAEATIAASLPNTGAEFFLTVRDRVGLNGYDLGWVSNGNGTDQLFLDGSNNFTIGIVNVPALGAGDVIRIEVQGQVLTAKLNGVVIISGVDGGGAPISSGSAGMFFVDSATVNDIQISHFAAGVVLPQGEMVLDSLTASPRQMADTIFSEVEV